MADGNLVFENGRWVKKYDKEPTTWQDIKGVASRFNSANKYGPETSFKPTTNFRPTLGQAGRQYTGAEPPEQAPFGQRLWEGAKSSFARPKFTSDFGGGHPSGFSQPQTRFNQVVESLKGVLGDNQAEGRPTYMERSMTPPRIGTTAEDVTSAVQAQRQPAKDGAPTWRDRLFGPVAEGAKTMARDISKIPDEINKSAIFNPPEGRNAWLTIGDPGRGKTLGPPMAVSHGPDKSKPAGAEAAIGVPSSRTAKDTATRSESTGPAPPPGPYEGNRYWDMAAKNPMAQQNFLDSLPQATSPVQLIRGNQMSYWSPVSKQEYQTPLEAAFAQKHEDAASRAQMSNDLQKELLKASVKNDNKPTIRTFEDPNNPLAGPMPHELMPDGSWRPMPVGAQSQASNNPLVAMAQTAFQSGDEKQRKSFINMAMNLPEEEQDALFANLPRELKIWLYGKQGE